MDPVSIAVALTGVNSLTELLRKTREAVKNDTNSNPALRQEIEGVWDSGPSANKSFSRTLERRASIFAIRVGRSFDLPFNSVNIHDAIQDFDVVDWTLVTDFKSGRQVRGAEHLIRGYCDESNPSNVKHDISTTYLGVTSAELPTQFGNAIYISGSMFHRQGDFKGDSDFPPIYHLDPEDFRPTEAVIQRDKGVNHIKGVVATAIVLSDVLDWVFTLAGEQLNDSLQIAFGSEPGPGHPVPSGIKLAFQIK